MTVSACVASWSCRAKPKTRRGVRGGGRLRYRICRNSGPHFNIIGRVLRFGNSIRGPNVACIVQTAFLAVFTALSVFVLRFPRPQSQHHEHQLLPWVCCRSRFALFFGWETSIMSISCSPCVFMCIPARPPVPPHVLVCRKPGPCFSTSKNSCMAQSAFSSVLTPPSRCIHLPPKPGSVQGISWA